MKIVAIDLLKLKNPNSGLGQFCLSLAQGLLEIKQQEIEFKFIVPKNLDNTFNLKNIYFDTPFCDLLHKTHQESRLKPVNKDSKILLTIHDLNFLIKYIHQPIKKIIKKFILQRRIYKATALNFISKFIEQEVRNNFFVYQKLHTIIYNGVNPLSENCDPLPFGVIPDNYLLSVGIVQPKKKLESIFSILEKNKTLLYVIAGPHHNLAYLEGLKKQIHKSNIADRVFFLGEVSENLKSALYRNCKCYVFPSDSEGFGLPVIEAFSVGKPVFLNTKGALPEIGSNLAFYFDSNESEKMTEFFNTGLNKCFEDSSFSERAKEYSKQFSRENFANAYFNFYKEILNEK